MEKDGVRRVSERGQYSVKTIDDCFRSCYAHDDCLYNEYLNGTCSIFATGSVQHTFKGDAYTIGIVRYEKICQREVVVDKPGQQDALKTELIGTTPAVRRAGILANPAQPFKLGRSGAQTARNTDAVLGQESVDDDSVLQSTFAGPELTTVPAYELLGWEYYHETNMCYKKFRVAGGGNQDVKESEKNCTGYGGNLASIHSAAQNNFLQHMLPIAPCVIGLKFVENQCGVAHRYWSDSSVVNFENWEPGEPNNNMCEQFCTYLQSDGTWNNYRCDANSAFVCETDNIVYCPQRRT
ncbi:hypothetical protein RB195_008521 [Necator americanus]|uniref:C-type lectin domain-containing protein n=1 Tax=Necator americanus TaxID=51031 RepID=A0ABR1CP42_NECAM